ncbi:FliM/FliN family flagellar motor switch protein [Paenirhodobacter enshiensis]|uniref:FliM/FliN family flagellar motor switch protein n=1 Tax=Paenirhodobacter enshiensis TaxID=1105367 RepID=UPI00068EF4E2|nr:FliM/FliN family flagellar motor C-terminal domain-containing protein [Paenirhodobacter enshiensis]
MTDETDRQVLRRMIEAGRRITRESTADAALSLAVTRAGQDVLGLMIEVPAVTERHMTLADLPEVIEDRALRLVIEGPGGGLGLMVLGVEVLSAIVQMQTIGRLCRTDTANRRPTRTDAAMAVEFVDRLLSEIERELAGSAAAGWGAGFRYASWIEEGRPLATLLEDTAFRVWKIEGRLGPAGTGGDMLWVVPADGRGGRGRPPVAAAEGGDAPPPADPDWDTRLSRSVLGAHARLDAVLNRMALPLSEVLALRPGMEIPLPGAEIGAILVEAEGRRLARGRLGQFRGQRAVLLGAEEVTAPREQPQPGPSDSVPVADCAPDIDMLLGTVAQPLHALG